MATATAAADAPTEDGQRRGPDPNRTPSPEFVLEDWWVELACKNWQTTEEDVRSYIEGFGFRSAAPVEEANQNVAEEAFQPIATSEAASECCQDNALVSEKEEAVRSSDQPQFDILDLTNVPVETNMIIYRDPVPVHRPRYRVGGKLIPDIRNFDRMERILEEPPASPVTRASESPGAGYGMALLSGGDYFSPSAVSASTAPTNHLTDRKPSGPITAVPCDKEADVSTNQRDPPSVTNTQFPTEPSQFGAPGEQVTEEAKIDRAPSVEVNQTQVSCGSEGETAEILPQSPVASDGKGNCPAVDNTENTNEAKVTKKRKPATRQKQRRERLAHSPTDKLEVLPGATPKASSFTEGNAECADKEWQEQHEHGDAQKLPGKLSSLRENKNIAATPLLKETGTGAEKLRGPWPGKREKMKVDTKHYKKRQAPPLQRKAGVKGGHDLNVLKIRKSPRASFPSTGDSVRAAASGPTPRRQPRPPPQPASSKRETWRKLKVAAKISETEHPSKKVKLPRIPLKTRPQLSCENTQSPLEYDSVRDAQGRVRFMYFPVNAPTSRPQQKRRSKPKTGAGKARGVELPAIANSHDQRRCAPKLRGQIRTNADQVVCDKVLPQLARPKMRRPTIGAATAGSKGATQNARTALKAKKE